MTNMKKITIDYTFATAQYENAKTTLEIEIPEGMSVIEEYKYLYNMFHDAGMKMPKEEKPKTYPNTKWGKLQARKDGVDIDNDAYLGTDGGDEGARIDNMKERSKGHGEPEAKPQAKEELNKTY